jgi:hypothetical protein
MVAGSFDMYLNFSAAQSRLSPVEVVFSQKLSPVEFFHALGEDHYFVIDAYLTSNFDFW